MVGLTLFLAVLASWGVLHTISVFMRHQLAVVELHKRVKVLRAEYLSRSKSKRGAADSAAAAAPYIEAGPVIEVGPADEEAQAA